MITRRSFIETTALSAALGAGLIRPAHPAEGAAVIEALELVAGDGTPFRFAPRTEHLGRHG